MNWEKFVEKLRALDPPFRGDGDDFDEVTAYLKVNGIATDAVEDSVTGHSFVLKELFDSRKGRKLDISDVAAQHRKEEEIEERVRAVLEERDAINGTTKRTVHNHDVKVGRNRVADDPKGGFKHVGEFFHDVIQKGLGREAPRLDIWTKDTVSTYGSESVGAEGGFAVPTQFRDQILIRVMGEESILSRTDQLTTSSNSLIIPYDEDEPWNTTGIQAEWSGEAGQMTQRAPVLTQKELKLRKLVCLVPLTEELMSDAPGIGTYVASKAADVIDFRVGEAIFRGVGNTQPLGFLNSGGTISVAAESNQGNQTIVGLNVMNMWRRLYGPYRRNAVWFINQNIETWLMRLSIIGLNNTGGAISAWGGLLYMPAGGVSGSPFNTLFGRPVITTEHCEELGAVGDICLCAMDQYATLTKGTGIESASSTHIWFDQDVMALKFRFRIDGQPWSDNVIDQRDDPTNNTLGAFITLAARE